MASITGFRPVASLTTVLPSTFTPFMSCVREIYLVDAPDETCHNGTKPTPCSYLHLGEPTNTAKCFPRSWRPGNDSYLSPAACPRKYTVACAQTGATETIATCCPDDGSQGKYECVSELEHAFLSTDRCSRNVARTVEFVYTTTTLGETVTKVITTSGADVAIYAYGAEVRWQSSDFSSATSAHSSESSEPEPGQTGPADSEVEAVRGLSTTAKAGIGAGAGILFLCLVAGIIILWRRRQYHRQRSPESVEVAPVSRPEDSCEEAMKQKEAVQFGSSDDSSAGSVRHEADAQPKLHEVYTKGIVPQADSRAILELESPR